MSRTPNSPAAAAALALLASIAGSTAASAHPGDAATASFAAGLAHPFGGWDHVLAMVAVGLWAGLRGGRALWVWPAAFVGVMVVGFGLGSAGIGLPLVEPGILASVVVLGVLAAFALPLPVSAGAALVGLFALLHGHAHGAEAPAAGLVQYAAGFALATALLHAVGLGIAAFAPSPRARIAARIAGGAIAAGGVALAAGLGA